MATCLFGYKFVYFNSVSFEVLLYTLWDCFPSEQLNCIKKNSNTWTHTWKCKIVNCVCIVANLCPALPNSMDCSPPCSCVHNIAEKKILEWAAIAWRTRGIFPTQGSNLHLLPWQPDSLLLSHQGSPTSNTVVTRSEKGRWESWPWI